MMMRYRSERGQSLLEFALILMVMFFIGVAALDLGRVFFATIVITNASREGARYYTLHPDDSESGFVGTQSAAEDEVKNSNVVSHEEIEVNVSCPSYLGCVKGTEVDVTVEYEFFLATSIFFPSSIPLSRTTRMLIP